MAEHSPTPTTSRTDPQLPADVTDRLRTPFDAVLSDPTRLRIQAALHGLNPGGSIRFTALAKALGLSDGNLSAHLAALSEVGYVEAEETYTGKRRTRWYSATAVGRAAFDEHVAALQLIVDTARLGGS
ncbi:transcriptional regulator [Gulosibacter faecalis]|uniref:Transcriptional regulator n=1 Tax=Gulosibacter faecalis TaxID=272240 RepID=A0ABW5UTA3_9MICO|nr:transcriptional regulator [Gulosibacter faecalis]